MKSKIFGILVLMEAVFMLLSSGVSLFYKHRCGDQDLEALLYSTLITFVVGGGLFLIDRKSVV